MADQGEIGRPIQIIRLEGESRISLDIDALQAILLAADVKNLPVVVVSVAGRARKGKSFLLNFFLQYMRNRTQNDWMSDLDGRLGGFSWCCGSEPETSGIWMWSEVFEVTTKAGKRMAVLFLDTQGTFDNSSTMKDCVTIFSLSMMASSMQIYNLSQNIDEDDLQHLQLFTEYGRLAFEATKSKPFQKLLFLVRDWQYKFEKPYGFGGGKSLLDHRLSVPKGQKAELKQLRDDIKQCFTETCCFLMPNPGEKVTSTDTFVGCLDDINAEFKEQLRVLVPAVLEPNNLLAKNVAGLEITCQELLVHIERYVEMFNGDELPEPRSMIEATAEANNSTAANRAIDDYREGMEKVLGGDSSYIEPDTLRERHLRMRQSALEKFMKEPKIGGVARSQPHKDRLLMVIDELFQCFSKRNEGARIMAQKDKIMDESRKDAQRMIDEAHSRCDEILEQARTESQKMRKWAMGLAFTMALGGGLVGALPALLGPAGAVAQTIPMAASSMAQLIQRLHNDDDDEDTCSSPEMDELPEFLFKPKEEGGRIRKLNEQFTEESRMNASRTSDEAYWQQYEVMKNASRTRSPELRSVWREASAAELPSRIVMPGPCAGSTSPAGAAAMATARSRLSEMIRKLEDMREARASGKGNPGGSRLPKRD